jgi:hypothetical protein
VYRATTANVNSQIFVVTGIEDRIKLTGNNNTGFNIEENGTIHTNITLQQVHVVRGTDSVHAFAVKIRSMVTSGDS